MLVVCRYFTSGIYWDGTLDSWHAVLVGKGVRAERQSNSEFRKGGTEKCLLGLCEHMYGAKFAGLDTCVVQC